MSLIFLAPGRNSTNRSLASSYSRRCRRRPSVFYLFKVSRNLLPTLFNRQRG
jgi:hypothetical protein